MRRPDHNIYRDWLTMDAEGELSPAQRAELEEHLASCASCRAEREELLALDGLLQKHSVAVRPDFKDAVLSSLPTAGWESRHPKTWSFPAAVFLLLAGIAVALFGSAQLGDAGAGGSALLAMAGLLRATVQAGAGLLAASWKGAGLVIEEVIASPVSLAALAVLVICLNLILVSLLRRKRTSTATALGRSGSDGRRI
jgi:anti-sigma factor RsiW